MNQQTTNQTNKSASVSDTPANPEQSARVPARIIVIVMRCMVHMIVGMRRMVHMSCAVIAAMHVHVTRQIVVKMDRAI